MRPPFFLLYLFKINNMTINELYQWVQFMANKEQRGFIKPSEFNLLAGRAQLDIIQDRYGKYTLSGNPATGGYSQTHSAMDDIRTVVERTDLSFSSANNGAWSYPSDMLYFLKLEYEGNSVEILTQDQLRSRLNSALLSPTSQSPVAAMIDDGFEIFTSSDFEISTGNVECTYIKNPNTNSAPNWTFTVVNGMTVFESTSQTQNLLLPEHTHNEIAQRMLSYIGINLRETAVSQYGDVKTKDKEIS